MMKHLQLLILIPSVVSFAQQPAGNDTLYYKHGDEPYRIMISKLSLNSDKSDFCPFASNNILIFSSARLRKGIRIADATSIEGVTDIYWSVKKDSAGFDKPIAFPPNINTFNNEGPASVTSDFKTLYFSGSERENAERYTKTPKQLKLFVAEAQNKEWKDPVLLPFCVNDYTYCHPAINSKGNLLIFSSDMPGGYGGMDLYSVEFENGHWQKPVNLGPGVNTDNHELFPFISDRNTLYFSCAKNDGFGGLDIYSYRMNNSPGEKPVLLEKPINSEFDDFGFWCDSTGESGYFSSNRNAMTEDDVYSFKTVIPDFSKSIQPPVKTKYCYTFYEEASLDSQDTLGMSYEWDFGDGTKARSLRTKHCYEKPGVYEVQLNVVENQSGEVFLNEIKYSLTVEPPEDIRIEGKDTVIAGSELKLSSHRSAMKGYSLLGSYWSFGDGKYNYGKNVIHKYQKPGEYILELGVVARSEINHKIEMFKIEKKIIVKENS